MALPHQQSLSIINDKATMQEHTAPISSVFQTARLMKTLSRLVCVHGPSKVVVSYSYACPQFDLIHKSHWKG